MNTSIPASSLGPLSPRAVARILVIILTAVVLIVFNSSFRTERAPLQNDFDAWLQTTKQSIATSFETAPPVAIALKSERPEFRADWRMTLRDSGDPERVVRILELAKEANVFSRSGSNDTQPIRLTVSDGSREFVAAIAPQDMSQNVAAANLVRLFQLYAVEMPSADTQVAKLNGSTTAEDKVESLAAPE